MKKRYKKAFSLLELSIVILIVSILAGGSLVVSKTAINKAKVTTTKAKMDTIYKAFTTFLASNRRLPCPALLNIARGTNSGAATTPNNMLYGQETGAVTTGNVGTGVCNYSFTSSNAANLAYGAVPVVALGLDPDFAEDAWGTKFDYVVDTRFTSASSSISSNSGFEITKGTPSLYDVAHATNLASMDIQGPGGNGGGATVVHLLPNYNGIFLLMSHGFDQYNGWNAVSTAENAAAPTTGSLADVDENTNSCNPCATSGANFNNSFVSNSANVNFDDIVLFKTKSQLVKDAGLESIMCSDAEAQTASYSWGDGATVYGGNYNCNVCDHTGDAQANCGKYGTWGSVTANNFKCAADTQSCPNINKTAITSSSSSYVEVYSATEQTGIATNTATAVNFNALTANNNFADPTNGGNNVSSFTPNTAGYWLVSYNISSLSTANHGFGGTITTGKSIQTWIGLNGSAGYRYGALSISDTYNSANTSLSSSAIIYFNGSTDSCSVYVWQDGSAAVSIGNTATPSNSLSNSISLHYLHS